MLSRTMYAMISALAALVLVCAFACSFRVEYFTEEAHDVVGQAGQLSAEKLPPEEEEEEKEAEAQAHERKEEKDGKHRKDSSSNRVPQDKIPESSANAASESAMDLTKPEHDDKDDSHADAPAPKKKTEPMPSPPREGPGNSVEPFVGGMLARF